MSTTLINQVSTSTTYPIYVSVTATNCCGIVNLILEDFTEQMSYEIPAINIDIYTINNGKKCLYRPRALTIFTNEINRCESYTIMDIPQSCQFAITPIFDKNAVNSHNEMLKVFNVNSKWKTTRGNIPDAEYDANDGYITEINEGEEWTVNTDFNITLTWDDVNIKAGGGSGSSPTPPTPIPPDVPSTLYYGWSDAEIVSDLSGFDTLEMTATTTNLTFNESDNQYLVIAYPATYKDITSIIDPNGFRVLSTFNTSMLSYDGITYKLYVSEYPPTFDKPYTYVISFD